MLPSKGEEAERPLLPLVLPEFVQAVEEGLAAGERAHVAGMLVDLDGEEDFAAHALAEELQQEGVRAAAEIGDVGGAPAARRGG